MRIQLNILSPLKTEERGLSFLFAFLLFTVIAAFIVLKSARDALFLSHYSTWVLPYFEVLTTLTTSLVTVTYLRLYRVFSLGWAISACLIVFIGGTLLLWMGIHEKWGLAIPLLFVWADIFGTLAPVQAWSLINQRLLTRQAKRTLGIIGAGGIVGGSMGGLFSKWIAKGWDVPALLPTAAVLMFLTLVMSWTLSTPKNEGKENSSSSKEPIQIRRRFVILVLMVVAISTLVSAFADFQFKVIAQRELATDQQLATFFGSFYAYLGGAALIFQIFATSWIMRRLGAATALSFLPLALAIGNSLTLATNSLWSVVFLKGSEQLFKHSVDRSSLEVLYTILPDPTKIRLKSLIEIIGVRVAEGIAALLLVLLFSVAHLPVSVLAGISLPLLGIWIGSTVFLRREYPQMLEATLQYEEIDLAAVKETLFTPDFYRLLPEVLRSSGKQTLLDLLELLETSNHHDLGSYLGVLLKHRDKEIRLKALQVLFSQDENLSDQVKPLLKDPDRRVQIEAVHYLGCRSSRRTRKFQRFLRHPDLALQAAACASLLNGESDAMQQMGYKKLEELISRSLDQSHPEVRIEIAHVLEYARPSAFSDQLYQQLLSDPSPEVRKAALHGIARTHPSSVAPTLIKALRNPGLRSEVRTALTGYGESLFPHLRRVLEDDRRSLEQKKLALKILADIGGPRVPWLLLATARKSDLVLRFLAIKALNRLQKHQSLEPFRSSLESLLEWEMDILKREIEFARSFSPRPKGLMEAVLYQRQIWTRERIFRLLGLLYEPTRIYNAYLALLRGNRSYVEASLEFLDEILSPRHRNGILPLLEPHQQREERSPNPTERRDLLFHYLLDRDPLPAAAAIADLTPAELVLWKDAIKQALEALPDLSLVEETLNWRCAQMETSDHPQEKNLSLTTIQKLESLGKTDIFSRLGPHELLLLSNESEEVEFQPGQVIFTEGEVAQEIFSLVSGNVELHRTSGHVELVKPGESFGTLEVLTRQPRLFSARALEHCLCLKLDRESFWEILEDYPAVSQGIFEVLVHRIQVLTDHARCESRLK
ncbi:MAG TPA: HEAT repeat domain-containing protein [Candidatus Limnocylindrales bacterium]|nr:HEAT repeat domain-containing protein [Candidatus Limnocylindrales bacterium]